ncbi:MAG: polyprenyl diphosphate synthase, partial [Erythrobacter sp.]|uniref:polyprenyl diphosphate synthase n=1 Tax=Erythrobacter sp. TaxID=1042 RepID=UPI0025D7DBF0
FIKSDLPEFVANNVKLKIIGDWQSLAPDIVAMLEDALAQTANGRQTLAVALNYGGQHEIARAAAKAAAEGEVSIEAIAAHLDTHDLPPLDLLIRTSGEIRLSNFLLWQAAYAEMLFVDTLWPDFEPAHLTQALNDFARRERRYGGR